MAEEKKKKIRHIDFSKEEDEDLSELNLMSLEDIANMDKAYYPTQFSAFNFLTGKNLREKSMPDGDIISKPRGFREGNMVLLSGDQGIGKTTFALNSAGGIKRFADNIAKEQGLKARTKIHLISPEDGMELYSIYKNCYIGEEEVMNGELFAMQPHKVFTRSVGEYIERIYEAKMSKPEFIIQKTVGGKNKKTHIPDIILLDSLSTLLPEKLKDVENDTNMYDAQVIKDNNKMLKSVFSKLREANIMLFVIVHCSNKINTSMFDIPMRDYQNLSKDKKLSGGKVAQYLTDLVLFFNKISDYDGKKNSVRDLISVDDMDIGYATELGFLKNRFGDSSMRSIFPLVFDYSIGFNPQYSLYYEIMTNRTEVFETSGSYKALKGYEKKFYNKEVPNLLQNDPIFRRLVMEELERKYSWLLEANNRAKSKFESASLFMESLVVNY